LTTIIESLNTTPQAIRTVHSELPSALRLTLIDCLILLYVDQNRNVPYDQWPEDLRKSKAVEKLRKRRYLHRSYWPTKYTVARAGFSLVKWIYTSLEHSSVSTAA